MHYELGIVIQYSGLLNIKQLHHLSVVLRVSDYMNFYCLNYIDNRASQCYKT